MKAYTSIIMPPTVWPCIFHPPHFWRPITGNDHPGRNSKAPLPVSHIPNTISRPVSKQADFARAHRSFRSGGRGHCRE